MKKSYLSILSLATMALVFGSCQQDESDSTAIGGEVDVTLSAGLPSGLATYGPSHLGGATNVDPDEYDLRYTLEVYDGDNMVYEATSLVPADFSTSNASFSARLLAKKYKFVLWADFIANGATDDLYYNTDDLRNISYTNNVNAAKLTDDAIDAYYKVVDVDLTTGGKKLSGIQLQRPFGKIRFVATDALSEGVNQTEIPASVKIDFKGASVPSSFNALTGESNGAMTIEELAFKPVQEDANVGGVTKENAYILGYAYLFATEPASAHEIDVTVYSDEAATAQIGIRNLSNIPVAENKLTTVVGNFFTNEGDIDVIVEDEFGNTETIDVEDLSYPNEGVLNTTTGVTYETIAAAIADAQDNAVLTLAAQQFDELIDINNAVTRASVTAPASLTIVGQKGSFVQGASIYAGNITLKNIEFNGTGAYATIHVGNDAKVALQNCTINAPEGTAGRPIETTMSLSGSFIVDGCVIYNNGRTDSYLNPAAKSGVIQVTNSEFMDGHLAAEYQVDNTSSAAYPVIKGNTFSAASHIGVSDITAQSEAVNLSRDVKLFINEMIDENSFADADQVKVVITPLPYDPDKATIELTEKIPVGPVYNETTGHDYMSLRDAVVAAEEGNVIILSEGKYDLGEPGQADEKGPNGYYLKIDKAGLILKGEGDVKVFTSHQAGANIGGTWSLQNLVTVKAENVTFDNITFYANYNEYFQGPNKIIEVYANEGNNFTIKNCTLADADGKKDAGSLYIGSDGEPTLTATVENCTFVNAGISVRPNTSATVTGCTFDGIRETEGWNTSLSVRGKAIVTECGFTNCDGAYASSVVTALGDGFIDLVNCNFPSDNVYWTSHDNGIILINGTYSFSGGEGTYEEPYKVSTPEDILMIGKLYKAGYYEEIYNASFEMTEDIDISDTPVKNLGVMGCLFDGNGHKLTVNLTSESGEGVGNNVGLFAGFNGKGNSYIYEATTPEELNDPKAYELNGKKYIIKGGCIRDLVIEGSIYSNADGAVSPLGCGQNTGYIINVKNYADITAEGDAYFVAGIISGTRGTGLVLDCENYGTITVNGNSSVIGGITAQLYGGSACDGTYPDILAPYAASVQNCKNYGEIIANGSKDVGGIVGQTHGYGYSRCIVNCVNEGNITGNTNVGGIIGRHASTGGNLMLSGNTNTGTITSADGTDGPIYGKNEGTLIEGSQSNE